MWGSAHVALGFALHELKLHR